MPIPTDYREIINSLAEKTNEGDLRWKKDKFSLALPIDKSKFSIWAGNDEHSDEPFVAFGLYEDDSTVVDTWFVDQSDSDYSTMNQLYKSANRQARGVPQRLKALNALISDMKSSDDSDEI